jgi:hypothetical protein
MNVAIGLTEGYTVNFARTTVAGLVSVTLCLTLGAAAPPGQAASKATPRTPFSHLFDTGTPASEPLTAAALASQVGWHQVPEDQLTHRFAGDAVCLNDRIVLVVRRHGQGAELYARTPGTLNWRALLIPLARAADNPRPLSGVRILENTPGAVMLEATFGRDAAASVAARFRLTTGQIVLEIRGGEGMRRLLVRANPTLVVVPDFFADDMIFTPAMITGNRIGLPTENQLLQLVAGGDAMLMCVWPSNTQHADAIVTGEGAARAIAGSEIDCPKDAHLWLASLEGKKLWHRQTIPLGNSQETVGLDWRPPFPAKWRGSLVGAHGIARSWQFRQEGKGGSDSPESAGARSPCCITAERAFVETRDVAPLSQSPSDSAPLVVYPLDRSRGTPLSIFCMTDILRATLGVGPCQYILEAEGLDAEEHPTPAQVTAWVEKLFAKKRSRRSADLIRQRLDQMTALVGRMQQRIDAYRQLAVTVRQLCADDGAHGTDAKTIGRLSQIATDMERIATASVGTAAAARRFAAAIAAMIGQDNAVADCRRVGTVLRALGNAQQRTLSQCRMAARRLQQECRMASPEDARAAACVGKVRAAIGVRGRSTE